MINDPHDINGLDPEDIGLKSIMGVHFIDETQGTPSTTPAEKAAQKPTQKPREKAESDWRPPARERDWMDNLKECAKWSLTFGGLSCLIFYWQQAELMASSIAVPCMCVCTALVGWGVGRNALGGKK